MTDKKSIYSGISNIAIGYLLILIDINIISFDILPNFVGYILFIYGIKKLKYECKKITLLTPFGIVLMIWSLLSVALSFISVDLGYFDTPILLIITIINIYFNFQLLTELSLIAEKHQKAEDTLDIKIKRRRTVYTVLFTAMQVELFVANNLLLSNSQITAAIFVIQTILALITAFMIVHSLFMLRNLFKEAPPSNAITS